MKKFPKSKIPSGAIALISLMIIAAFALAVVATVSFTSLNELGMSSSGVDTDKTFYAAEAGINEALIRMVKHPMPAPFVLQINGIQVQVNVDGLSHSRTITSQAIDPTGKVRKLQIDANSSAIAGGFDYAVQSGVGGLKMENNCSVTGDVYSNGPVYGANEANPKARVFGNVWVADQFYASAIDVSGNLYANTIKYARVGKDAYYQTLIDTVVIGQKFSGSPNPIAKPFPIGDSEINEWKAQATSGGVLTGNQNLSGTASLGPKKIEGNLSLDGNARLTINGQIWVTGDINFSNPNTQITISPSLGEFSAVIIADGRINVNNNAIISGSGDARSFLLILSTSNSLDPSQPAISTANNSNSVVFYAKNGMIRQYNNSTLHSTTGHYVLLEQNSIIIFDPNLPSFVIPSGDLGESINPIPNSWQEL
ncbi:MAG: pilus assembly PilX N-terminal domain-containing protein [Patescibacteria group bacterium]|jgi:hypothetical protein